MTTTRFVTADVFTDRPFGGNPLAVFPDGRGLSAAEMQTIAKEFNLSETVFVLPPEDPRHTRRLRIFTPRTELPFAGHPTVGSAHVLAAIGEVPLPTAETRIVFEEGVGPVPVTIRGEAGRPVAAEFTAAKPLKVGPDPPSVFVVAAMLSLQLDDLRADPGVMAVSAGIPFTVVPVVGLDAVRRARLRRDVWEQVLAPFWAPSVFVYTPEGERPGSDLHARMFAPGLGVDEDPATGAAATALAGLLASRHPQEQGTLRWVVEQGFEMGRPSILHLAADKHDGAVTAVRVGGSSVLISRGEMEVPA
jgi:trans-2,3-dihydro-3-hydroxyanthranilate isomerase